jgi:hypothetical protein
MSKISIEVDSDVQEAFEQASEAEKQEIKSLISVFFRQSLASKNLVEVMEEIGTRAEARGLTPEILADILEDTDGKFAELPNEFGAPPSFPYTEYVED